MDPHVFLKIDAQVLLEIGPQTLFKISFTIVTQNYAK